MCSVHGLQIGLRVPVAVVENDSVGGHEIDAEAAGTGAQEENKNLAALFDEAGDLFIPIFHGGISVDAVVLVPSEVHVVLQNVQDACHLGENEHLMFHATVLKFCEQLVENHDFSGGLDVRSTCTRCSPSV